GGIPAFHVTGVQTCALPISIDSIIDEIYSRVSEDPAKSTLDESMRKYGNRPTARNNAWVTKEQWERLAADGHTELGHQPYRRAKIGRASRRDREALARSEGT